MQHRQQFKPILLGKKQIVIQHPFIMNLGAGWEYHQACFMKQTSGTPLKTDQIKKNRTAKMNLNTHH